MDDLLSQNEKLELTLLSAWLDLSTTGLCAVDDTSRVVMLNPAACEILGIDGLDMLNQPLRKLLSGLNIDDPSLLQWLCTPGFDGERDITRTDQNGIIQILLRSSTHRAQENGMFKIISITDVTELRTAQTNVALMSSQRPLAASDAQLESKRSIDSFSITQAFQVSQETKANSD